MANRQEYILCRDIHGRDRGLVTGFATSFADTHEKTTAARHRRGIKLWEACYPACHTRCARDLQTAARGGRRRETAGVGRPSNCGARSRSVLLAIPNNPNSPAWVDAWLVVRGGGIWQTDRNLASAATLPMPNLAALPWAPMSRRRLLTPSRNTSTLGS